ncbi:MAG: phosphatidylserine decarboxylase [Endomicrobium sp.]|jgi:phosphatidylserine decarboxylase precursor|nr:phosphatidylserine decarboxylase [Endomicrobium sp.]
MYRIADLFSKFSLVFMLLFVASSVLYSVQKINNVQRIQQQSVTNELVKILEKSPEIKDLLIKSIESAKKINPDIKSNPAQTLEDWYTYIDWSLKAMPWKDLRKEYFPGIFEGLDQGLDYFYFILDQPLEELKGKGLYYNSLQYYEPIRSWVIKYVKQYGAHLDTRESWNLDYYDAIYNDFRFGFKDHDWYEDPDNWRTFNDFFSRHLKSPSARSIADKDDDSVIVSPADSVPEGVWRIDMNANIVQKEGVKIKSSIYYYIPKLLGETEDSPYRETFDGGYLTHTFLNVQDYHRFHFPVSGVVKKVRIITQDNAVGGITTWDPKLKKYVLDSRVPGWQSIETRGLVILETKDYGTVALLPVGMSQVNSVKFENNVKVGKYFSKGDPLGYFLFGGSDFIMLFQKKSGFQMTAPKEKDGTYKHILMGEKYGTFNKK